jgi:thioredoxin-like negative regulator of GroEL
MGKDIYNEIYSNVFRNQTKYHMKQLIYFYSTWCGPCKTLGPIMEKIPNVTKINVDSGSPLVVQYGVKAIPTVVILENEQEVSRFIGVKSESEILNMLK